MPDIICPVCGEINPADQEFCQSCQSRLKPLSGAQTGADAPIQPGQLPTKKHTAELEPILPDWLKEARDKARKTAEEQGQPVDEPKPQSNAPAPDFLAGLQSQTEDDEEETPDWLASITGTKPKPKKTENESPDVRWVELGKPDEFMQHEETESVPATQEPSESPEAQEGELPPWLANMQAPEQSGPDELTAWLHEADAQPKEAPPPTEKGSPFTQTGQLSLGTDAASSQEPLPDWLKNLQADQAPAEESPQPESQQDIASDLDWLSKIPGAEQQDVPPVSTDIPSWLKKDTTPPQAEFDETPAWLRSTEAFTQPESLEESPAEEATPGELPDWLKAAAPTSSVFEEKPVTPSANETPDWLSSLQADAGLTAESSKSEEPSSPAFTEDSLGGGNVDQLFTEMPDWLSSAATSEAESTTGAKPPTEAESITPGDLPSWVQAMRPVESSLTPSEGSSAGAEAPEMGRALAGLQGVLPAVAGMGPSSRPKSYSIKLDASEEQLAHASLLEQILAAETAPEPIASFAPLNTQRGLRWLLAFLLLAIVTTVVYLRPGIFALPIGETNDIRDARLIMEALPPSAPVLVVVDYEPALAGEIEAVAAPLLERGIILKQPVLTFISTSPTGGLLAEHLISGPLKDRGYQRGNQYVNLGYLPGGLSGVRAFAMNPPLAAPFDMDIKPTWIGTPLAGINSLSQFAAMIVITDNAESARTWIEQTADQRPNTPLIMISSAQAAPMIQPYYDSRQVSAVVSGLHGGAIIGQSNAGLPSLAQNYWDAFSLGVFLAVILIAIGALWNLALGFRDRALEGK